jgi:DUF4097 and DUF4098 domain-containing protein YvlB
MKIELNPSNKPIYLNVTDYDNKTLVNNLKVKTIDSRFEYDYIYINIELEK